MSDYPETVREFRAWFADEAGCRAYLEKEQARVDLQGQLADATHQRASLIAETRKTAQDTLNDALRIMAESTQDERRADVHSQLLRLLAPVDGTVQQLTVHTVGGVVPVRYSSCTG